MSIKSEITRLYDSKADIKKEVNIDFNKIQDETLDNYAELIKATIEEYKKYIPSSVASGNYIVIKNVYPLSAKSLVIDGKCYQKKVNLLPNLKNSLTTYGIKYTANEDGTYIVNGTQTSTNANAFIPITENDSFSLPAGTYYNIATYSNDIGLVLSWDDNGTMRYIDLQVNSSFTLTQDTVIHSAYLQVRKGSTIKYENYKLYPMISLVPITEEDYTPYTDGKFSPSPEYPQEIEVVEGYNLFDFDTITSAYNKTTNKIVDYKNKTITLTSSSNDTFFPAVWGGVSKIEGVNTLLKTNTDYTLSYNYDRNEIKKVYIYGLDPTTQQYIAIKTHVSNNVTFNTGNYSEICIRFGTQNDQGNTCIISNIQLVEGNEEKPYLPYGCIGIKNSGKNLSNNVFEMGQYASGVWQKPSLRYTTDWIEIKGGETYSMSLNSDDNLVSFINFNYFDKDKNWLGSRQNVDLDNFLNTDRQKTFTLPPEAVYFRATCRPYGGDTNSITLEDVENSKFMLEHNIISTEFEPYREPTITYIDLKKENLYKGNYTWSNQTIRDEGNYIEAVNTALIEEFIEVKSNTSYITNYDSDNGTYFNIVIFFDENKNFISREQIAGKFPFITPENCKYIKFTFFHDGGMTISNFPDDYIYNIKIYEYNKWFEDIFKLCSIGNEKDVYKDGVITKKIFSYTYKNSDNDSYAISADNENTLAINLYPNGMGNKDAYKKFTASGTINAYSDQFIYINNTSDVEHIYVSNNVSMEDYYTGKLRLYISKERLNGYSSSMTNNEKIELVKQYLEEHPLTVYGILPEPEEIELEPIKIQMFEGTNNLELLTNLETNFSVEYYGAKEEKEIFKTGQIFTTEEEELYDAAASSAIDDLMLNEEQMTSIPLFTQNEKTYDEES